jgi:hypothetical protein
MCFKGLVVFKNATLFDLCVFLTIETYSFYNIKLTIVEARSNVFPAFTAAAQKGDPSRESNPDLPYSKPMRFYLSYAAPYKSFTSPRLT